MLMMSDLNKFKISHKVRCSGGHIGFLTRSKSALYHKYLYHVSCHFKKPKLEFKMSIRGSGGHTGI
jgi:hypothetical protein